MTRNRILRWIDQEGKQHGRLKESFVLSHYGDPVASFLWVGNAMGYVSAKEGIKNMDWDCSPEPGRKAEYCVNRDTDGTAVWEISKVPFMPFHEVEPQASTLHPLDDVAAELGIDLNETMEAE